MYHYFTNRFLHLLFRFRSAKCDKFVIDVVREILIIYERFYEIYGDILAAKNSFDIKAYEMGKKLSKKIHLVQTTTYYFLFVAVGGLCVGRVTWSCLAAPDK